MNDRPSPRLERRKSIRITPKGTVILSSEDHIQRGRIANLCRGGMLVATTVTPPNRLLGRTVGLQLRLDGQTAAWVVETSTPLEAIVRLGESSFEPDLIAIADSAPSDVADDLRRFVKRNHPRAKLVTIGDELDEPTGSGHWISSADPDADLKARPVR